VNKRVMVWIAKREDYDNNVNEDAVERSRATNTKRVIDLKV